MSRERTHSAWMRALGSPSQWFSGPWLFTLVPAAAFLALAVFCHYQLADFRWESRQLFSIVDGFGAVTSILLGVVLLLTRAYQPAATYLIPAYLALVAMGIALAAKSFTEQTEVSIWLDNLDTILGAILFATVFLSERWMRALASTQAFVAVCLLSAFSSGALLFWAPDLPKATEGVAFSVATKEINLIGAMIFLAVALHLLPRFRRLGLGDFAPMSHICFFFGVAALVLPFSELWSLNWWLAQLAQVIPVLIALRYVLGLFTKSQRDLFLSEHRFKTIFSESPVAIGVVGRQNTFVEANPALCRILGYSPADLARTPVDSLTYPEDTAELALRRREAARGDGSYQMEMRLVSRDDRVLWVKLSAAPVRDTAGVTRELRLMEDITAEKEAEVKIRALVEDLSQSNAELDRFTSMVSHDLRSPLCTITSFTQLLTRHMGPKLDETSAEYFGFVVAAAKRMGTLIDDLLAYSRASKAVLAQKPVPLGEVVSAVNLNLAADIRSSGAIVEGDGLPEVVGDQTQLVLLFQNLIGNALKYRGDRPPVVHVSAERVGPNWDIRVKDNGMGFDMAEAERIFEPFRRLHGVDEIPGTGLGLSICRTITKRHGGAIRATSEPGKGSEFLITLPVHPPKAA